MAVSASAAGVPLAPPFLFFGPFARPFRTSESASPEAGGSLGASVGWSWAGLPVREGVLEVVVGAGGPRASMFANPGLNREASLLVSETCLGGAEGSLDGVGVLVCFCGGILVVSAGVAVGSLFCFVTGGISSFDLGFSRRLLCLARASGVGFLGSPWLSLCFTLPVRPIISLLASASGFWGVAGGLLVLRS